MIHQEYSDGAAEEEREVSGEMGTAKCLLMIN